MKEKATRTVAARPPEAPRQQAHHKWQDIVSASPQALKHQALAGMVNNSPRTLQQKTRFRAMQQQTQGGVLQRVVDLTTDTDSTAGHQYFVKTDSRQHLYSVTHAMAPRPDGLYEKQSDVSTNHIPLFKWIPNVRLFSNDEKSRIQNIGEDTSDLMQTLDEGVRNPEEGANTLASPNKGILGKNDCKGLGGVLNTLISQEGVDNTGLQDGDLGVGDQMTHHFPDQAECNYHSATVVATDTQSLVTLEADVSTDRPRPEFHVRNGVAGFVQANNTNGDGTQNNYGNRVSINRAKGKPGSDYDMQTARRVHADYAKYNDADFVCDWPGVTDTEELMSAKEDALAKIREICGKYWGKYTNWKFTPTGVKAIRDILANDDQEPPDNGRILFLVQQSATGDLNRVSGGRKQLTTDFYTILSTMSVENPASLRNVIIAINALIARMDAKQD